MLKHFFGENLDAEYNDPGEYQMPNCVISDDMYTQLMDYIGIPPFATSGEYTPIQILDFRMYQRIWNEWFRASEVQPSIRMNYGDTVPYWEKDIIFNMRKVGKLHDYFTSALPRPQAGDSVFLPLGQVAPVVTLDGDDEFYKPVDYNGKPMQFNISGLPANFTPGVSSVNAGFELNSQNRVSLQNLTRFDQDIISTDGFEIPGRVANPRNLFADLAEATALTVSQLRTAITVQQLLELDSLGGTRYTSLLRAHFGVLTPDDVLQRVQFLGSTRQEVGMRAVAQTSSATDDSTLGTLGAFSATHMSDNVIVDQAFTEPGVLMVLACVRPLHTYSQGIDSRFTKLSRFDHYYPVFDGISNQPIFTRELVASVPDGIVDDERVFGYKPAWEEYRIFNNRCSGKMRPGVEGSLSSWNYADYYEQIPMLNATFIEENDELIDRTIAIQNEPQFLADFYFHIYHQRPMGARGIPGLTRF